MKPRVKLKVTKIEEEYEIENEDGERVATLKVWPRSGWVRFSPSSLGGWSICVDDESDEREDAVEVEIGKMDAFVALVQKVAEIVKRHRRGRRKTK